MKKIGFAAKVFGIIILTPVLVILELNHGLPDNKENSVVVKKVDTTIIQLSLNAEVQNDNAINY